MRLRTPLDDILISPNRVKILRILISPGLELSGREIAAEARINHAGCARALRDLAAIGILRMRKTGKAHLYSVRRQNRLVERGLNRLFLAERELFDAAINYLRSRCGKHVVAAVLFGSYARGEERADSDLDIFFAVGDQEDAEWLAGTMDGLSGDFDARFGVHLNSYVKTLEEARAMAARRQPPVSRILREGRDLFGHPLKDVLSHADATSRA